MVDYDIESSKLRFIMSSTQSLYRITIYTHHFSWDLLRVIALKILRFTLSKLQKSKWSWRFALINHIFKYAIALKSITLPTDKHTNGQTAWNNADSAKQIEELQWGCKSCISYRIYSISIQSFNSQLRKYEHLKYLRSYKGTVCTMETDIIKEKQPNNFRLTAIGTVPRQ